MTETQIDHSHYEEWDAAYVLGALSPAERREFEEHLATCELCQAAVGALAGVPGLLGRLSPEDAFALLDEPVVDAALDAPPLTLTTSLAHAAARRRRRTRGWTITALSAAAAVAVAALVLPPAVGAVGGADRPATTISLGQEAASPLSATVGLTAHAWGTSIDMTCSYKPGASGYGAESYALYVTDAAGASTRVSTWTAKPGDTVRLTASTSVQKSDIRSVELRDADSGTVLLSSQL